MAAIYEKWYPIFGAALVTLLLFLYRTLLEDFHSFNLEIANNALSISVTLIGFLLTILTLINTITSRRMQFIKDSGAFPRLLGFLRKAIVLNLWLIAFSFLEKYINPSKFKIAWIKNEYSIDYCFFFFFLWTMLASYRFTKIFVTLLSDPKKSS